MTRAGQHRPRLAEVENRCAPFPPFQPNPRIPAKNILGCIKRFRLRAERYRSRSRRFGLRLNLISGIYNFKIDLALETVRSVSQQVYLHHTLCADIPTPVLSWILTWES